MLEESKPLFDYLSFLKKIGIGICTLIFSFAGFAQTAPEKKIVRWGAPDLPKECCADFFRSNRLVTTYSDADVYFQIGVDVETEKKFVAVLFTVGNKSDAPLTIYPENFSMKHSAPNNKIYNALPVEQVAAKIENRGRWRGIAASMLAGMATKQTTADISDNRGNRGQVVVTEPDRAAQRRAANANAARRNENEDRADLIRAVALPTHTLFKDEVIGGFVFFKKEDLAPGMVISFTLGDTIYEIPYGIERSPNADKK